MAEVEQKTQQESHLKSFMNRLSSIFWGIYFVQKMTNNGEGISKISINRILRISSDKGGFGLLPDKAGAFLTDVGLGWYVKALFGPISDNLPIFGYRRKSWLIIGSLLTAGAWFYVSFYGTSTIAALFVGLMIVNIFVAFADVVCDGLMIQSAQKAEDVYGMEKGTANRPLQTAQWQGAITAILISSIIGGIIGQFFHLKTAAFVSGLFPLALVAGLVIFVEEEKVAWDWKKATKGFICIGLIVIVALAILWLKNQPENSLAGSCEWFLSPAIVIGSMLLIVKVPKAVVVPFVFIFMWAANPLNSDSQYFYQYFTEHNAAFVQALNQGSGLMDFLKSAVVFLRITDAETIKSTGMQDVFFGSILSTIMAIFFIIGSIVFKNWLNKASLYKVFVYCIVGQAVAALCFAVYPVYKITSPLFIIICGAGYGFLGYIVSLSLLMYAAEKTPATDQASIFAFMMGLFNMGNLIGMEKIGSRVYTLSAGVKEVGGKMVAVDPHRGFLTIIIMSLVYLGAIWVGVYFMNKKGLLSSDRTAVE